MREKRRVKEELNGFISEKKMRIQIVRIHLDKAVFEDYIKDIMEETMVLKSHKSLFQLGDYYHCILYLFDMTDNDLGIQLSNKLV